MFGLMLVGMMVPVQVTIVPLFKIMNLLGVINTAAAVTLPSVLEPCARDLRVHLEYL